MAGKDVERSSTSGATRKAGAKRKTEVIEALGIEQGVDSALSVLSSSFASPFYALNKSADEQLREVIRLQGEEAGPTIRQLVAMRRMDGQARALYRLLTLPIRASLRSATIKSKDGGEEERDFIDDVFNLPPESGGMTVTMSRFMGQLLQGLFDGFSAFEKVYWVPEEGPLSGKITLKKMAHRPAETVTFLIDKTGGFAGLRQRTFYYGKPVDVVIPRSRAFYYAAQEEEQKYYGVSFFQTAYYHFDKKSRMYYAAHIAANRAAVGTRIGTVPSGASKNAKAEFGSMLRNLSMAQWLMMPEGFKVDVLNEGGTYDFLAQINHHNSQMSKSVLAPFFDKEQGSGQSESSLVNFAQPGDDMFKLMLRAIQDDIADQINHYIIPQLIDLNFGSGKYPKFVWGELTDEQNAAISSTFDKLANQQSVTPEFMRALEEHQAAAFGLDVDYDEVALREEEEAIAEADAGTVGGAAPAFGDGAEPGSPTQGPSDETASSGGEGPDAPPPVEGGTPSPQAWNSLEDFEAALGAHDDSEEENDDFEESLNLAALDDFENLLALSGASTDVAETEEGDLLTLAHSLLEMAGGSSGS